MDYMLERLPYSFRLEAITLGGRLSVWAGGEDYASIKAGAPFIQSLVPGSKLVVVPGGSHGFKSEPHHLGSILRELREQYAAAKASGK